MFDKNRLQYIFFFALIGAALVLSFFVLRPYLLTLILALVLSIAINPVYMRIRRLFRGRNRLASVVTIILVLLIIIIPISFFAYRIFLEAQGLYTSIASGPPDLSFLDKLAESNSTIRSGVEYVTAQLDTIAENTLNFFVTHVGVVFASVATLILNLFLLIISVFFILSRREELYAFVKKVSPLDDEYDNMIIRKIRDACNSVVRGNLTVALVQGIVAAVGFSIFNVPAPMIWGGLAAIAALVPNIGTTLITAPAIIYLFATGQTGPGIGLLIWAVAAVGMIDNVLAPVLIERGIRIHPLIILLAVLGGISLFGAIGFILGPVILAFLVALLDAYAAFTKKEGQPISSS